MSRRKGIPGVSFSWKRATGLEVMPGIYLGAPSLENLRHFIDGYVTCRQENDSDYFPECLSGFQEYVEQKYGLNTAHGWSSLIQFFSSSDEDAFKEFYKIFNEYALKKQVY